jgi:hypothetical protein
MTSFPVGWLAGLIISFLCWIPWCLFECLICFGEECLEGCSGCGSVCAFAAWYGAVLPTVAAAGCWAIYCFFQVLLNIILGIFLSEGKSVVLGQTVVLPPDLRLPVGVTQDVPFEDVDPWSDLVSGWHGVLCIVFSIAICIVCCAVCHRITIAYRIAFPPEDPVNEQDPEIATESSGSELDLEIAREDVIEVVGYSMSGIADESLTFGGRDDARKWLASHKEWLGYTFNMWTLSQLREHGI